MKAGSTTSSTASGATPHEGADPQSYTAVILCGGMGTRLRDVVADRPKSLAEVSGRPFLAHLLDHLSREGIRSVVLSAGYMADQITAFAGTGETPSLTVKVVVEPMPLGTAGALRFAIDQAGVAGSFLALNGDTYFDGSLRRLLDEHETRGAVASIGLAYAADAGRYGAVQFDEETLSVHAFTEKGVQGPGWINAGVYVLSREAMAGVKAGVSASLERDVLPTLAGHGLIAVPYAGATFLDIGTPADYAAAASFLSSKPTP